ncbi:MAG: hypothetical protein KGN76_12010 [Acidobacteriota bacterium]|nr:hypothetical protein [Acidobacteriota bacterium]
MLMYKHTQPGYLTIGLLLSAAAVMVCLAIVTRAGVALRLGIVVLLAAAYVFGSLTTEVDHERFRFWFGSRLIRRSFLLSEIRSCRPVTNRWWYGLGIHRMPDGWLYNVSGAQAVELTLQDGRKLRVGTDEPVVLCEAIRKAQQR